MVDTQASRKGSEAREPARRSFGLDGLRGLAILLMCLSGVVPNGLPNAMYHGYYPRFLPDEAGRWAATTNPWQFRGDWPSFTWVDWVFPMFLFAMGAAIPLALSSRRGRGWGWPKLAGWVAWRWLVLIGFAVYVRQIAPHFIDAQPTTQTWLVALLGFALLFPVFLRLPRSWPVKAWLPIRVLGLAGCIALVCWINGREGRAFKWSDNDIIILLLAHCSLFAGLMWLALPKWPALRLLLFLPLLLVPHHQAMSEGWRIFGDLFTPLDQYLNLPRQWLDFTALIGATEADPKHWANLGLLWNFTWLKFMWIVLPGTAVGDLLLRWMRDDLSPPQRASRAAWSGGRLALIALLFMAGILGVLAGAKDYGQSLWGIGLAPMTTPWAGIVLGLPCLLLAAVVAWPGRAGSGNDRLVGKLALWSLAIVGLGLALCVLPQFYLYRDGAWGLSWDRGVPLEGGIKKGPPATLSYYALSLGLSLACLGLFTIAIDLWRLGRQVFGLLVLNGQNPMLAYAGIRNLLAPLVQLPLLKPLGIAGVTSLEAWGTRWLPEKIAGWAGRAELSSLPWVLFVWSMIKTLALAVVVAIVTRAKGVWRV